MHITMKSLSIPLIAVAILLVGTAVVFAQPPPPTLPSMPSQAPIDGGLGLLAAAGGAYALKKLRGKKSEG